MTQTPFTERTVPGELFKNTPLKTTGYEDLTKEATASAKTFDASLDVATNQVIKSLEKRDNQQDKYLKLLHDLAPKFGKSIGEGIKTREQQALAKEWLMNKDVQLGDKNYKVAEAIINQTRQELAFKRAGEGNTGDAIEALGDNRNAEIQIVSKTYLNQIRERVHTRFQSANASFELEDGTTVTYGTATPNQKAEIRRKIDAALIANMRQSGQFSDKELMHYMVLPLQNKGRQEYEADVTAKLEEQNIEFSTKIDTKFTQGINSYDATSGSSTALSNELNALPKTANKGNHLDARLNRLLELYKNSSITGTGENDISYSQAYAAVFNSGKVTHAGTKKTGTISEVFGVKTNIFLTKLDAIRSEKETNLTDVRQALMKDLSAKYVPLFGNAETKEDWEAIKLQFDKEVDTIDPAKAGALPRVYWPEELRNITIRGFNADRTADIIANLKTRTEAGFVIPEDELATYPASVQELFKNGFTAKDQDTINKVLSDTIFKIEFLESIDGLDGESIVELKKEVYRDIAYIFNEKFKELGADPQQRSKALLAAIAEYNDPWALKLAAAIKDKDKRAGLVAEIKHLALAGFDKDNESAAEINKRIVEQNSFLNRLRRENTSGIDTLEALHSPKANVGERRITHQDQLLNWLADDNAPIPHWYVQMHKQFDPGQIPVEAIAIARAEALGLDKNLIAEKKKRLLERDPLITKIEHNNRKGGAGKVLQLLTSEQSTGNTTGLDAAYTAAHIPFANELENPYDFIDHEGPNPLMINNKKVKLSEVSIYDLLKHLRNDKSDRFYNIGAFGMSERQLINALSLPEGRKLLDSGALFNKETQRKLFNLYFRYRGALNRQLKGSSTGTSVGVEEDTNTDGKDLSYFNLPSNISPALYAYGLNSPYSIWST